MSARGKKRKRQDTKNSRENGGGRGWLRSLYPPLSGPALGLFLALSSSSSFPFSKLPHFSPFQLLLLTLQSPPTFLSLLFFRFRL